MPSVTEGDSVLLNPQTISVEMFQAISLRSSCIEDISIPTRLKSVKNLTEIANIGKVMVKDGIALPRFFHWFESAQPVLFFSLFSHETTAQTSIKLLPLSVGPPPCLLLQPTLSYYVKFHIMGQTPSLLVLSRSIPLILVFFFAMLIHGTIR